MHRSLRASGLPVPKDLRLRAASSAGEPEAAAGTIGRVVIDVAASPLMPFSGYVNAPERAAERFSADRRWYYTGDVVKRNYAAHAYPRKVFFVPELPRTASGKL